MTELKDSQYNLLCQSQQLKKRLPSFILWVILPTEELKAYMAFIN